MAGGDAVAAKPATADTGAGDKASRARFLRQFELVERIRAYDPQLDEHLINRAYVYATSKHGSQKRHSGDPYFAHPIEVAGILTEYKLDTATIVAGLLHDTIEDTNATSEEIAVMFGPQIAELVDGVTKLSLLEMQSEENKQAQNLQKFILAMSQDVRVLLVKLADRLHNMRTLLHRAKVRKAPPHCAGDARNLRAARAPHRHGADGAGAGDAGLPRSVSGSGSCDHRAARTTARAERRQRRPHQRRADQKLDESGLGARVYGREKQVYSIWRKLQRKSLEFSDLADVYAFRVIVDEARRLLSRAGHDPPGSWRCVPEQVEDYISNPSPTATARSTPS